eukprot:4287306-Alexandrium_andersonii.AAC.1
MTATPSGIARTLCSTAPLCISEDVLRSAGTNKPLGLSAIECADDGAHSEPSGTLNEECVRMRARGSSLWSPLKPLY